MTPASYLAALLPLVPLSISCDQKAPGREGDDGLATPPRSAAAQADLTRREMIDYVRELQAALTANDRERFSKLLVYPVRVQASLQCTVVIPGAGELVRHFDAIVTPTVQRVILNARPPFPTSAGISRFSPRAGTYRAGTYLGSGEVWLGVHYGSNTVTHVSAPTWKATEFGCEGERREPAPAWLDGTWQVTSVQPWQGLERHPEQVIGRTLTIDTHAGTVGAGFLVHGRWLPILAERQEDLDHGPCRIERFAVFDEVPETWSDFYMVGSPFRALYIACARDGSSAVSSRVHVATPDLLVFGEGMNAYYQARRLEPKGKPPRQVGLDSSCGQTDVRCGPGLICVEQPVRAVPRETCWPLDDYLHGFREPRTTHDK